MKVKIIETYVREIEAPNIEEARKMWENDMECLYLTPEDFESVEFYESTDNGQRQPLNNAQPC